MRWQNLLLSDQDKWPVTWEVMAQSLKGQLQHAVTYQQYKHKRRTATGATSCGLQVAMLRNCHIFYSFSITPTAIHNDWNCTRQYPALRTYTEVNWGEWVNELKEVSECKWMYLHIRSLTSVQVVGLLFTVLCAYRPRRYSLTTVASCVGLLPVLAACHISLVV